MGHKRAPDALELVLVSGQTFLLGLGGGGGAALSRQRLGTVSEFEANLIYRRVLEQSELPSETLCRLPLPPPQTYIKFLEKTI